MKSTGIVRKVDELGRIVLPIELRRTLDIEKKDSMDSASTSPPAYFATAQRISYLSAAGTSAPTA